MIISSILCCFGANGLIHEDEEVPKKLEYYKMEDITDIKDRVLSHCFIRRYLSKYLNI